ncbi:hypothetical protein D3C87_1466690 [compost metagenome]
MRPLQAWGRQDQVDGLRRAGHGKLQAIPIAQGVQQGGKVEEMLPVRLAGLVVDLMLIDRPAEVRVARRVNDLILVLSGNFRSQREALLCHGDR